MEMMDRARVDIVERYQPTGLADIAGAAVLVAQITGARARTEAEEIFLDKAVRSHAGKEIHVVLDNLSTHTTPEVLTWLEKNPHVTFHFTPVGSSWLNQVEIWFGIITRQAIGRGTFTSVRTLIRRITDYINTWNADPKPFNWVATADDILAKVKVVEANVHMLIDNNTK
jgi:transposase